MNLLGYLPFILLTYFSIKFIINFIKENIISINEQLELVKIEKGIISINDLQTDNYTRFLSTVNLYLTSHGYENIVIFPDGNSNLTSMEGILNGEKIYINCFQNDKLSSEKENDDYWSSTSKSTLQCSLARMIQNNYTKGLIINNSTFNVDAINFIQNYNLNNLNSQILLVDGYELTRSIRNYKNYVLRAGNKNEFN